MAKQKEYIGVGRRKTAVASVWVRKGKGEISVNRRKIEEYFTTEEQRNTVKAPLEKLALSGEFDVLARTKGGGIEAQAVAIRLGIARALVELSEDNRQLLKAEGFLTRDPRKRERKKYGQPGARKRFQFSKR